MPYFLGIDGGGSKTECAIADDDRVLAQAVGASCKIQQVGEEAARAALHQVIAEVCSAAAVPSESVTRACIGMAGVSRPDIGGRLRRMAGELLRCPVDVVGDNAIALEAAFGAGPGVIVISGTGSIAFGRNRRGEQARAGGWGPAVSDEGSGGWIGRAAVAAVMRAHDVAGEGAREVTLLTDAVFQAWGARTPEEVAAVANRQPPPDFAALFPAVLAAAEKLDAVAASILADAGRELAALARSVTLRLWPSSEREVPVRVAGGVFGSSGQVRRVFCDALADAKPRTMVDLTVVVPVEGALQLARKAGKKRDKAAR